MASDALNELAGSGQGEQMPEALTKGELAALREVKAGNVTRIYRRDGNVYKGRSPRCLRSLEEKRMIRDGPDAIEGLQITVGVIVTPKGNRVLLELGCQP